MTRPALKTPTPTPTPRLKQVGGFELLQPVGKGAMGTVYRARQSALDRIVAVKVLAPHVACNQAYLDRFQREARACAKLNHPHIVQGIDVGRDDASGVWYFAMEMIDGMSLKEALKDAGVLPERRALQIVRDVAEALACAAKHGIVHRDIKPDNILLTREGETKLADLGLAKLIEDEATSTQTGIAVGTPHYMAPEQARAESHKIDVRTDIYSLGATLFHLVTGRTLFSGPSGALIMSMHCTDTPRAAHEVNAEVSDGCSKLIARMVAKSRRERFQSPGELITAIDRLMKGSEVRAKRIAPPTLTPSAGGSSSRKRSGIANGSSRRRSSVLAARKKSNATLATAHAVPPERAPRREAPEIKEQKPSFFKGFAVDLAVLLLVVGLLYGGVYYLRSEGHLAWLRLPVDIGLPDPSAAHRHQAATKSAPPPPAASSTAPAQPEPEE